VHARTHLPKRISAAATYLPCHGWLLACAAACCGHVAALLAGCATGKDLWLGTSYATAEAAARARDRAVLALQRAGLVVPAGLNFPEAAYQGEELLQLSGTAVGAIRCWLR
jgi:hypothetical protein